MRKATFSTEGLWGCRLDAGPREDLQTLHRKAAKPRPRPRTQDLLTVSESQSRSVMLHRQDRPVNSAFAGTNNSSSSSSLRNRKGDKDGNFNFLSGKDDEGFTGRGGGGGEGGGGGDENRNQVRPCNLGPLGRDPPNSSPSSGFHHNSGILSPRSRLPWSPLEPLPEIESGDDGYGRVPPDGAEERRTEEEVGRVKLMMMMMMSEEEDKQEEGGGEQGRRKSSVRFREEEEVLQEDENEWGDSDSESESGGSMSSLNMESGGEGKLMGGWDRIGVGEPKSSHQQGDAPRNFTREPAAKQRGFRRKSLMASTLGNVLEEGQEEEEEAEEDQSTDSDCELPELMDAVWTLRDRERFKAQEMEKHQVQLTMYRRLALIRWVRTLQSRVQEQQNRLQSSFDVILDQRKELLRMGAAAAAAATMASVAPPTVVGQS